MSAIRKRIIKQSNKT